MPQQSSAQVDRIAGVTREDWQKTAIAASAAEASALDRVLVEVQSLRRLVVLLFAALFLALLMIAAGGVAFAISLDHRVTNLERRLP
jgi:hypothetical protein